MTHFFYRVKPLLAAALLFLCCFDVSAANGNDTARQFLHWNTNDGMSNGTVTGFLRVRQGYLWVATENGLTRYDGNRFKVYKTPAYWQSGITSLHEDGSGDVWLERYGDYARYDHTKDAIDYDVSGYLEKLGIEAGEEFHLFTDRSGDLWVVTHKGINHYSFWTRSLRNAVDAIWKDMPFADLSLTDEGDNIAVLQKKPLKLLMVEKRSLKVSEIKIDKDILDNIGDRQCGIYADEYGSLWLYTRYGDDIYRRQKGGDIWHKFTLPTFNSNIVNSIRKIGSDAKGHLWIATDKFGIYVYNYADGSIDNIQKSANGGAGLVSNNVNTICPDHEGNIWIGYYKLGMSVTSDTMLKRFKLRYHEIGDINTLLCDSRGEVWIGTEEDGLWHDKDGQMEHLLTGKTVSVISEDTRGRIWVGTFHNGVYCINGSSIVNYNTSNSDLPENAVIAVQPDRLGNVWIGTQGSDLSKLVFSDNRLVSVEKKWNDVKGICFSYDKHNNLYVGTYYGWKRIDIVTGEAFTMWDDKWAFCKMVIPSLALEQAANRLWICNPPLLSVFDLNDNRLYELSTSDGLCDDIVNSVTVLDNDKIIAATSKGLSYISVTKDTKGELTFSIENFSECIGIDCIFFNRHANTKLSNGNVLLGTPNGCVELEKTMFPARQSSSTNIVRFTGMTLSGREIQPDSVYDGRVVIDRPLELLEELKLNYDDRQISFFYSLTEIIPTVDTRYAYRIEGLHDEWVYTNDNQIVFNSLSPGEYVLQVRMAEDIECAGMATLRIVVTPPFYMTTWAILIYVILIVFTVVFVLLYVMKHQHSKLAKHQEQLDMMSREQMNETKMKFFTNVSHDLRTPITLILTPLQMLLKRDLDNDTHHKLEMIDHNAKHLLSLVNTLLDFRRIENGAEKVKISTDGLNNFIRLTCEPYIDFSRENNLTFHFSSDCNANVTSDFDKISKIINNLLSNAFKFTPAGGYIMLRADQPTEDTFRIIVSDNGPGISDEHKAHIFERFYQTSDGDKKTGSGLGLSIVGEYTKLLGGQITITDNEPSGAVFTFTAPINIPMPSDGETSVDGKYVFEGNTNKVTVLVVDDNSDVLGLIADTMQEDYNVLTALDGREAWELVCSNNNVDFIVSDIVMPVMDGITLCRKIKNNVKTSHIPVVLLTANGRDEDRSYGMDAGAEAYITKPFDFDSLKQRIDKYLAWRETNHKNFSDNAEVSPSELVNTPLDKQLLLKVIEAVDEHIDDFSFSEDDLSNAIGMDYRTLYNKLMIITGKSPADFIRVIREKRGR